MKKVVLSVVAALTFATSAFAADMPVKAKKIEAAPVTPAWDIAFGGVVMSDYNFRGVSQSNRGPSGGAYFEPQVNTAIGQFYVGVAAWGIDWPSTAAYGFTNPSAEVDIYGGWRKTWGAFSLDLGTIYYYYPKEIFNGFTTQSDFVELYAKASYAITPDLTVGANVYWSPDVLHYSSTIRTITGVSTKADGVYASITGKWVTPLNMNGVGLYVSGEVGHWWLDNTGFIASGYVDPSYTYYNIGAALTYKALTLDFRYHDTDQSALDCTAFLMSALGNPSNRWCKGAFIVSAKFDTTLSALK